jgi:glycosyltransferase involved in cell wall biosynthesis
MKLAYIINSRIPTEKAYGHEDAKMCELMGQSGIEVELIAPRRVNTVKQDVFSYYETARTFRVRYLDVFDFFRWERLLGSLSFYLNTISFFLKLFTVKLDRETVVFTRMPEIARLFKKKGHKVVYECHEWFGRSRKLALYLLRNCDFLITTNRYIKEQFVKEGFDEKKILISTNGVDLSKFRFELTKTDAIDRLKTDQGIKDRTKIKKVLLYAGSFKTMGVDKGIDEIIGAFKVLNNTELLFIAVGGDAVDVQYYEDMADKQGVAGQCIFIGRQTQAELALWEKAADILLAPFPDKAHYRYFMTPLKLFEYMAAKRPIIASDLPSIREIMGENNCLFCQPGDAEDLAKKINDLSADQALADKIAIQAYDDVKKYSWEKRVEKILNFIK